MAIFSPKKRLLIPIVFLSLWLNTNVLALEIKKDTTKVGSNISLENPFAIANKIFKTNFNYKDVIDSLSKIEYLYNNDPAMRNLFQQSMMTYQSFAGNYQQALIYADKAFRKRTDTSNYKISNYTCLNATDAIDKLTLDKQVVMINEAHHVPMHRAFLCNILPILKKNGFKYLAIEAVDYSDRNLNRRKYPIQSTGFYIAEPNFGELLRTALSFNFTIVPYDDTTTCDQNKYTDKNYCYTQRDYKQALTINSILKKDPKAKIVVYAGFDHILEMNDTSWIHMAQAFKQITGIDPFTIDQVTLSEKSMKQNENPYYRSFIDEQGKNIKAPFILTNKDSLWVSPNRVGYVDLQIFHPRTTYINNLPSWLVHNFEGKKRVIYIKPNYKNKLLQVYNKYEYLNEGIKAVPLINIIISNNVSDKMTLPFSAKTTTLIIKEGDKIIFEE